MGRSGHTFRWLAMIFLITAGGWAGFGAKAAKPGQDGRPAQMAPPEVSALRRMDTRSTRWFAPASSSPVSGIALVVHGLNLNPDRMQNIIYTLNAEGVYALQVSLLGHGDNYPPISGKEPSEARMEAFKSVSYRLWAQDLLLAYRQAEQVCGQSDLPLFLVADSYGALLALELMLANDEVMFDRVVLFAPALSMRARNHIVRLLSFLPGWVWPSFAPGFYQANRGTPQAAYGAVFETLERFEKTLGPRINVPALIFIDPEDELISCKGLRQLKTKHHFSQWRIHRITKDHATATSRIHHLIITPAAVGKATWQHMTRMITDHLQVDGPPQKHYK